MADRRELGEVNLGVNSTLDGSPFGGGSAWFSDGTGAFSTQGGNNAYAYGDISFAGGDTVNSYENHTFTWGSNSVAKAPDSLSIGVNVGDNDYDESDYYSGQQNICIGRNLVVCSWSQAAQTLLGADITMGNYGYDSSYAYDNYSESQFAWGQGITFSHQQIVYGSQYYAYAGHAIVMGDDHYIDSDYYGARGEIICLGLNNEFRGEGGKIIGKNNVLDAQNGDVFLFGNGNNLDRGSSVQGPSWLFLEDTSTDIGSVGETAFWWGKNHDHDQTTGMSDTTLIAGDGHHVKGRSNDDVVFLWGQGGSNGHQEANEHMFGWSAGATSPQLRRGAAQYSFLLFERSTSTNAADQLCLEWATDFRRSYKVNVEIIAYDRVNNDQVALFELKNVLVYRSSHTGAPMLSTGSPVAVPSLVDTGGNSATWSARLVINGTEGCNVDVTGATGSNVEWTTKLSYLETGHDAA